MKTSIRITLFLLAVFSAQFGRAAVIWTNDFSTVTNWQIIFQSGTGAGASLSSDGNFASFNVASNSALAAFGPISTISPLVPFVPLQKADYAMQVVVTNLTGSMSYDIALDQFGANTNYLSSVLSVLGEGTFLGSTNIGLGGFTFDSSAVFLLPKITVHTGLGNQTLQVDAMSFTAVPEPGALLLMLGGFGMLGFGLRRLHS